MQKRILLPIIGMLVADGALKETNVRVYAVCEIIELIEHGSGVYRSENGLCFKKFADGNAVVAVCESDALGAVIPECVQIDGQGCRVARVQKTSI